MALSKITNSGIGAIDTLAVDTDTLVVDSTNNRVGIGTASPNKILHLETSGETVQRMVASTTNLAGFYFGDSGNGSIGQLIYDNSSDAMRFNTNGAERLRLDSSGNLLLGTQSTISSNTNGGLYVSNNGYTSLFNREDSAGDGNIMLFAKGGSTVGSIGCTGTNTFIVFRTEANGDGTGLRGSGGSTGAVIPTDGNGDVRDNGVDLGGSSSRFDDIFATNGTIQTSDANEKQQIAALTDAEITAAKAISQLFKTFKWNSAVEAKGDAARTHAGVIAQDVEAAMTAAGLGAGDYAFFISDTWTNDDGNSQTRKGIRYAELLAFIGAATEQRLADIETRLAALEAN